MVGGIYLSFDLEVSAFLTGELEYVLKKVSKAWVIVKLYWRDRVPKVRDFFTGKLE